MLTNRSLPGTRQILPALGLAFTMSAAHATNGTMLTGYGFEASSMGGTSIGLAQDSLSAANNPASMAYVGNRVDFDLVTFNGYAHGGYLSSENNQYTHILLPIPEGGVNYQITPRLSLGLSIYGAGAESNYNSAIVPIPAAGVAKAYLMQVNISPTVAYKILPNLSVGVSVIGGYEQLRLNGLVATIPGVGVAPIPSHGTSTAMGYGAGAGILWSPTENTSIGASYYSKVRFGNLSGYDQDVLASAGGHFDEPQHYGIGISYKPIDSLTLAFDWLHIDWSSVGAVSDPTTFGWHNQNVLRVGVKYTPNSKLDFMVGYSHANADADTDHLLSNFYAPALLNTSVTIGTTYHFDTMNSISAGYEHSIPKAIVGTGASAGTTINVRYDYIRIAYAHKF
ncbi:MULTISPECIES: OmpP1/FadL family transporter [Burkholderia cepacia complex]|uniref:OmpP1/FadL family transporter n=1 Tax=Burkholderia cepacia complex TaxID=87882 RepID=UPI0026DEEAF7|nr:MULTISPECIES: outer membrane protein transport protein [Burkholderia cepacia complex]MDO5948321.1 outer membrane protein transport protein [Burkholderia cepacia]MDS0803615.1 outer membrane protein transport protein [Burkholderia cenocepacia]